MKILLRLLILSFLFIIISCSSTTNSERYSDKKPNDNGVSENRRFSSANDTSVYLNEFDEEPKEEKEVDVNEIIKRTNEKSKSEIVLSEKEKIMMEIVKYLNTPYSYGGVEKTGIDCSAFTQNVFSEAVGFLLPRTASMQYKIGRSVKLSKLKFGDLLFFDTTKDSYPGHVGIFIGNNLFAHASFTKGVTVSSLESSYYQKRIIGAKRVINISDEK